MTIEDKTSVDEFSFSGPADLIGVLSKEARLTHVLSQEVQQAQESNNAQIRELVLEMGRLDILAEFVLGFKPEDFHVEMMDFQEIHQEGMILAWRGAAKTTFCTITRCIYEIIKNPNIRILLASDAVDQAKVFLKAIKNQFESNEKLKSIFGDFVTGAPEWTENKITVNKRTSFAGESTILCTGMGTALPSRHFDLIICDDLVTDDNSQTEGQRKKTHDYFYKTLFPTLESPHGRLWVIGTRWHEQDIYGWLGENDYVASTLILGALDEETDLSRWEEKHPTTRLHRVRKANLSAFELQYMCRTGVGDGGIFSEDHFRYCDTIPDDVFVWQGVDLAAGQQEQNDFFAHVTLAVHKVTRVPYLLAYRKVRLTFPKQVKFIKERFDAFPQTVRVVIESNNYQQVLKQQINESHPDVPCIGRFTIKDKVARANQLSAIFTDRPLHVKRGHDGFVRALRGFPKAKGSKDLFDALELALGQGFRGAKKKRRKEPGLI